MASAIGRAHMNLAEVELVYKAHEPTERRAMRREGIYTIWPEVARKAWAGLSAPPFATSSQQAHGQLQYAAWARLVHEPDEPRRHGLAGDEPIDASGPSPRRFPDWFLLVFVMIKCSPMASEKHHVDTRASGPGAVGPRLRELQRTAGLLLRGADARAGVARGHLSSLERGRCSPTLVTLHRIVNPRGSDLGRLYSVAPESGRGWE